VTSGLRPASSKQLAARFNVPAEQPTTARGGGHASLDRKYPHTAKVTVPGSGR
jgi:hypothetical protein